MAGALERAASLLAVHPVADGYNTLVWTLRQSPHHDIETPDAGVAPGEWAPSSGRC
ncbi:hypothetical protein [Streptomyces sp. H27-H5]|uniref:hypothetical protein n=1 Tax=Streptomyces sp. H27-H5 TaxID=2996460 RepID=UPI00226ED5BB|nr:hypothetical protein [Streptomyces sp. H27-H5]MCY0955724.1 hypothetical protein [Streptomyces sp. H27-H5]